MFLKALSEVLIFLEVEVLLLRQCLLLIIADVWCFGAWKWGCRAQEDKITPQGSSGASCLGGNTIFTAVSFSVPNRDSVDSDQRKREEDFYYTEVQVKEETVPEVVATASPASVSAPIIIQQALTKPEALLVEQPMLEPTLASSTLSQSAPSSFWHIQADHAYQVSCCYLPGLGHLLKSC